MKTTQEKKKEYTKMWGRELLHRYANVASFIALKTYRKDFDDIDEARQEYQMMQDELCRRIGPRNPAEIQRNTSI